MSWIHDHLPRPAAVLVACPKAVIAVWRREWVKHGFEFDGSGATLVALDGKGTAAQKAARIEAMLKVGWPLAVFVLNYELAIQPAMRARLTSVRWAAIIADECHRLKAAGGRTSWLFKALGELSGRRVGLTGTPMPHSPLDLYAQWRFLDPSILGTSHIEFKARYAVTREAEIQGRRVPLIVGYRNLEELERRVAPATLRVKIDDVMELPDASHVERPVDLEPESRRHYDEMEKLFVTWVRSGVVTAANALAKILRLQQIASGVLPDRESSEEGAYRRFGSEKIRDLIELLNELPDEEPVVVFARFWSDLDGIREAACSSHRPYMELSGRCKELAAWQEDRGGAILGVQIQAGGLGIDLSRSCRAVFYSLTHSLGDYEQALGRLRRPGQARKVIYYHLTARKTIDEKIREALGKRADVVREVLRGIEMEAHPCMR